MVPESSVVKTRISTPLAVSEAATPPPHLTLVGQVTVADPPLVISKTQPAYPEGIFENVRVVLPVISFEKYSPTDKSISFADIAVTIVVWRWVYTVSVYLSACIVPVRLAAGNSIPNASIVALVGATPVRLLPSIAGSGSGNLSPAIVCESLLWDKREGNLASAIVPVSLAAGTSIPNASILALVGVGTLSNESLLTSPSVFNKLPKSLAFDIYCSLIK